MKTAYIREWGKIGKTDDLEKQEFHQINADYLLLNDQAWSFLADFAASKAKEHLYLGFVSPTQIQVKNFVGVIAVPGGLHIEILPKTDDVQTQSCLESSRNVLWKMLQVMWQVVSIETTEASIRVKDDTPLPERLAEIFLYHLQSVVRRGIRKDYERIEAEEKFLKGQLQTAKQLRQPPGKQHLFQIEYDIFSDNRAENRLIHSALLKVAKVLTQVNNQRLARELRFMFDEVPLSNNHSNDFKQWRTSRDMHYYQPLLPWLKLILNEQSPLAIKDQEYGISFLYPMEKLFEGYVAYHLAKQLPNDYHLKTQVSSQYLATTHSKNVFQLRPDLVIYNKEQAVCVLDTKWKLLDSNKTYENINEDTPKKDLKSGISQADMYQLFAYGHAFLGGKGKLALIYPRWTKFDGKSIGPFQYLPQQDGLSLDIFGFDLNKDAISEINKSPDMTVIVATEWLQYLK